MATRGTRSLQVGRTSVALTLLAAAVAIIAGTALALLGFVFPGLADDADARDEPVPSTVERVADLPVAPTVLIVLALVLAVVAAAMVLVDHRTRPLVARCVLLVAGPMVVLAGAALVPDVVTPCLSGEVTSLCEAGTDGDLDYPATVRPFAEALLGWVPFALLHTWAVRRWWPEMVPRWVPGAQRRTEAQARG